MKPNLKDFGSYADSNRVAIWGLGEASYMFNVPSKKGKNPNTIANVAPVLIYDYHISKIQNEINKLNAAVEEIKRNFNEYIPEVIELRNISLKQATKEIKEFFEAHHGENLDAGHIMSTLCIDYGLIEKVLVKLEKEGKIAEVKL